MNCRARKARYIHLNAWLTHVVCSPMISIVHVCHDLIRLTTARVPKIMTFWVGNRSMMILNVSQMFASENQEKTSEMTLYWMVSSVTVLYVTDK